MKSIYNPTITQLSDKFDENLFYEDPDLIISEIETQMEQCPINNTLGELESWIKNQIVTRKVDTVWIHCTGTRDDVSVSSILNYWKNKLGWRNPGYHIIFTKNGYSTLQDLQFPTNGVFGHNATGIHISYMGGLENNKAKDTRNNYQQQMLHAAVQILRNKFPDIKIRGHKEVSNKACPCFEVKDEFKYLISN